jgi:GSH-dependent disulfide-bond oxidoreductase
VIELYGMTSPNVVKIILMLEEIELPYQFRWVSVWRGDQFGPDFVHLNPNSKVPVIVDAEGPAGKPYTVFESGAILIYLAEKSGQLLPDHGTARHDCLQWLMIQLTGVGPTLGQYVHFTRFAPDPIHEYPRSRYRTDTLRLLDLVDKHLQDHLYLGGEQYSIADVAMYPWGRVLGFLGLDASRYPAISRWVGVISARPAAQRALAKVDELRPRSMSEMDAANPEQMDRVFGRGKFARTA